MNGPGPGARIGAALVTELTSKRADLGAVVDEIHRLSDFFALEAAAPFSVPAPTELAKRDARPGQISGARLRLFRRLLALRAAALLPEAISALNGSRLVAFALALRGLLETAAVAAYHAPRLVIPPEATTVPASYDEALRAAIMSGRFDWLRFMIDHAKRLEVIDAYAVDPSKQLPPDPSVNIKTMLERLARRLQSTHPKGRGIVLLDYALLSDLCHPSVGSNFVFVTGVEPELTAGLVPRRETLLGFSEMLLPCLGYSSVTVEGVVEVLGDSVERLEAFPA